MSDAYPNFAGRERPLGAALVCSDSYAAGVERRSDKTACILAKAAI